MDAEDASTYTYNGVTCYSLHIYIHIYTRIADGETNALGGGGGRGRQTYEHTWGGSHHLARIA